ncbi:MAG: hypothetical protein JWM90_1353 [Thermoleophilia bacterium]|nr:hypothetical protein [Thermoleophilia bacterium]
MNGGVGMHIEDRTRVEDVLRGEIARIAATSSVPVEIEVRTGDVEVAARVLDVFLRACESLISASTRAGATRIGIRAWDAEGWLIARFVDGERGSVQGAAGGMRMALVDRDLGAVGGRSSLSSDPAMGTSVIVQVPVVMQVVGVAGS